MSQLCTRDFESLQSTGHFLDLLPTGALIIDSDLRIVEWNQTIVEWTSITKEKAIGEKLTTLFPNICENRYFERLTQVFLSGFPATYSAALHKHFLPIPARHGLDCKLMIQQTEVRRLSEASDYALITIQDVSFQYLQLDQLKKERADLVRTQEQIARMNQELLERNQDLDDFNRIASHDLQEPLRKIIKFGELLASNFPTELDEKSEQYLFVMQGAAERMQTLIRDLLTLSRAGRAEIQRVELDLHEIIDGVLNLLEVAIAEKNADIEVEPLPTVAGDKLLVTQLFQNLISNALKFSSDTSPRVRITAQFEGDQQVFGVQDNGIGMDAKHTERIFEPFVRLHSRAAYEGTGFGLSICKKAVTKHGGRIWVESAPAAGAHFKFTLPLVSENSSDRFAGML